MILALSFAESNNLPTIEVEFLAVRVFRNYINELTVTVMVLKIHAIISHDGNVINPAIVPLHTMETLGDTVIFLIILEISVDNIVF